MKRLLFSMFCASVVLLLSPGVAFAKPARAKAAPSVAAAKDATEKLTPKQGQDDAMVDALARSEIVAAKKLHKKGVSYDALASSDEMTGLMRLADEGDDSGVASVLALGANINAKNLNNETALWFAVYSGHEKLALNLLKKGANAEGQRPDSKECLMHMAAQSGLSTLALRLKKLTPKCLTQKDIDGRTPAEAAKSLGYMKLAKSLTPKK